MFWLLHSKGKLSILASRVPTYTFCLLPNFQWAPAWLLHTQLSLPISILQVNIHLFMNNSWGAVWVVCISNCKGWDATRPPATPEIRTLPYTEHSDITIFGSFYSNDIKPSISASPISITLAEITRENSLWPSQLICTLSNLSQITSGWHAGNKKPQ